MSNPKYKLHSVISIVVALMFTASVPVFAEHGSSSGSDGTLGDSTTSSTTTENETHNSGGTSTSGSTSTTSGSHDSQTTVQTKTETETNSQTTDESKDGKLHQEGANMVAELEKNHKPKSADEVKKTCQEHKQGLTTKFNAIVTNSNRIQDKINAILAKAETYKQTNNLNPANWDALITTAHTAQSTSSTSISALKSVTPTIDCNNASVANDVATFKTAAQQVRTNLKAYRESVKAVLQSLESVKSTDGSNQ